MELDKNFNIFNYINIDIIKKSGIISSNKCRNIINSLADLSKVLTNLDENNLPAISYFQAFMVREIGKIFGFNLQEMNNEINGYLKNNISNLDLSIKKFKKKAKKNEVKIHENLEVNINIIENYLNSEFLKSNKNFIIDLAKMFNEFRENEINNITYSNDNEKELKEIMINKNLTNAIFMESIDYIINIIEKSNGLFFLKNYLNIYKKLEKDLKIFSELDSNKYWGKKEMIIIKE